MVYKTDGITLYEGLESVRWRVAQYIGADDEHSSPCARLLELAVDDIVHEWRPQDSRR